MVNRLTPHPSPLTRFYRSFFQKRVELSLLIILPALAALFALGPAYLVWDQVVTGRGGLARLTIALSVATALVAGFLVAYAVIRPLQRLAEEHRTLLRRSLPGEPSPSGRGEDLRVLGSAFSTVVSSLQQSVYVLESMSGGVLTVDREGRVTTLNPSAEAILGWPAETLVGQSLYEIAERQLGSPTLRRLVWEALKQQVTHASEVASIRSKDRGETEIGLTTSLLRDAEGKVSGMVMNFRDLSQLHKLHSQMERADRLASLGSLAAGVAHEVRNPLGTIRGLAQLLKEDLSGETESGIAKRAYLDVITQEVDRLDGVVEQLLRFARPIRSEEREKAKPEDLNQILHQAVTLSGHEQGRKGIRIVEEYEAGLPACVVMGGQIVHAALNLILNAIEASSAGGEVRVISRARDEAGGGKRAVLAVQNHGPAIPAKDLEKIFDPFYTTKEGGTGLGLAIAHQIIAAHGGRIIVQSDDRTTEFAIELPYPSPSSPLAGEGLG